MAQLKQSEFKQEVGTLEIVPLPGHTTRSPRRRGLLIALVVAALVAGVLMLGIYSRVKAAGGLRTVTQQMAVPSVSVA
jgi:hypothetical protein